MYSISKVVALMTVMRPHELSVCSLGRIKNEERDTNDTVWYWIWKHIFAEWLCMNGNNRGHDTLLASWPVTYYIYGIWAEKRQVWLAIGQRRWKTASWWRRQTRAPRSLSLNVATPPPPPPPYSTSDNTSTHNVHNNNMLTKTRRHANC